MFENKRIISGAALSSLLMLALIVLLVLGAMSGCATQPEVAERKPAQSAEEKEANYFLVFHENGRLYPFADARNYLTFMEVDEVTYTRTRVGAGPQGETLVFGIMKKEAGDLTKPSLAEQFYDGKAEVAGTFYGEVVRHGRIHVFGAWQDFQDYLKNKEITFTFTDIGAGPKGETVIYALNKKTVKEGKPVALIEAFKRLRQTEK